MCKVRDGGALGIGVGGGQEANHRSKRYYKRHKAKFERRKAKRNPECVPTYGRYRDWIT